MRIAGLAWVLLTVVVAGCTVVVPASPAPTLRDTSWVVTSIDGDATPADYQPTMHFGAGGEVNGDNGCNLYAGTYSLSGTTLTLTAPAQTMMACTDPDLAAQESAFSAALARVAAVRTAGEDVELVSRDGSVALRLGPVPPLELAGTSWLLSGLIEGTSMSSPVEGTMVTLAFEADAVSGKACNSFRGSYELAGNDLTVGAVASTRMLCDGRGVMAQETLVLELLGAATTAQLNRGVLVLSAPDGRGLQFSRA